jgi:hypothetical protein
MRNITWICSVLFWGWEKSSLEEIAHTTVLGVSSILHVVSLSVGFIHPKMYSDYELQAQTRTRIFESLQSLIEIRTLNLRIFWLTKSIRLIVPISHLFRCIISRQIILLSLNRDNIVPHFIPLVYLNIHAHI